MKKILISMAFALVTFAVNAQDRVVKKAAFALEENNIAEAQTLIEQAMNNPKTKDFALAWNVQGDIHQRLFAEELNKAAAQQPMDTAKFATNLYACLDAYEKCNEFDVEKKYLSKNKGNLMKFRTFLMYLGQFYFQNHDFEGAFAAYDAWINFPNTKKMVANEPSVINDSTFDKNQVAYYACLAAYQGKNFDNVFKHIETALNYDKEQKTVRQLHLMVLQEKNNTADWIIASKKYANDDEGIAQNLLAYYSEQKDNASALAFADELIAANPNNKIANYSKGVVLFTEEKYPEALPYFIKSTEIDPTFADAYYNAGVCCCNEGYRVNEEIGKKKLKQSEYDKEIKTVKEWYSKAEPFFLKVRELQPEETMRWASRLKTIYYITNQKDKEKEMDAYLN